MFFCDPQPVTDRKSQIAIEYCYRRRESGISIFWVNAVTVSRFEESFKRIAKECGLVSHDDSKTDTANLVKDWLQTRHKEPWLMVVDNVDDEKSFFHENMRNGKTPSQSIPHCSHRSLLFTTRTSDMGVDFAAPAAPIMIPALDPEEGLQLVKERLQKRSPPDEVALDFLAGLDYIPLAITQAVAFIIKRKTTVPKYLEQFRKTVPPERVCWLSNLQITAVKVPPWNLSPRHGRSRLTGCATTTCER